MIHARIQYLIKDKKSFEDKVLPYIFGGGIFYKDTNEKMHLGQCRLSVLVKANTLSQLITASSGMLRYSPGSGLEKIEILQADAIKTKIDSVFDTERPLLGAIIKPSLSYNPEIAKSLLREANTSHIDFVKDDDASEYSKQEAEEIAKLAGNTPYLQKIVEPKKLVSKTAMVVPWVDGWDLLQQMSELSITASHCASLSPQVSWYAHIMFSRLAGASLVIVPDPAFDEQFDLALALEAASKRIEGIPQTRLIISGGINPNRIRSVLKEAGVENQKFIGFAVGSWILTNSNIQENIATLQEELKQ